MGSVDRTYRCPWCGRVGAGGYATDSVAYPICTDARGANGRLVACLQWALRPYLWDLVDFRLSQLLCLVVRDVWTVLSDAILSVCKTLTPLSRLAYMGEG